MRSRFEKLFMYVQGAWYPDDLSHKPGTMVAAGRGYLNKETIEFVMHRSWTGVIGTQTHNVLPLFLWTPFCSSKPQRNIHRDKGGQAVFFCAIKRSRASGTARAAPIRLAAVSYREAVNGRVALLTSSI